MENASGSQGGSSESKHSQEWSGSFNIKANDFRLIALVQYEAGVLMIRFFGSYEDYDKVNAETV